jgi:predicted nucleotidyltransferase component of viral defense system
LNTLLDDRVARAIGSMNDDSRRMFPVIEKEILHHDILYALHEHGFLSKLAFFGGTNLRLCHDASRFSGDLDFKGGPEFQEAMLADMGICLSKAIYRKYKLESQVSEPRQTEGNTRTWSILILTRPGSKNEKQQKIHLDVCCLSCHDHAPRTLLNHYSIDLGTSGLLIRSQSLRESYTDKLIAFALLARPLPRDVWDIAWLRQNPANTSPVALEAKLSEHRSDVVTFATRCAERATLIETPQFRALFQKELERFLPDRVLPTIQNPEFLTYIARSIREDSEHFLHSTAMRGENAWEL